MTDTKSYYETHWSPAGYNPLAKMSRDLGELLASYVSPTARCLDIGCGDGSHYADWLNQHASTYVGVDISRKRVCDVRAREGSGRQANR